MAAQDAEQLVPALAEARVSNRYVVGMATIMVAGTLSSGFDTLARTVSLPLLLPYLRMSVSEVSIVLSLNALVGMLANLLLGPLADRWGRKNVFLLALVLTAATSGLTAFITQAWQFWVTGALGGTSAAVMTSAVLMAGEETPARIRGIVMSLLTGAFAFGMIVVSAIGSVILASGNWRPLFYISFAPILVALAALVVLREPARAVELRRLKQGQELPSEMSFTVDLEKARSSEWRQIFASDLRRQTLVLIAGGFFIGFALVLIPQLGSVFLTEYNHLSVSMASLAIGLSSLLSFVAQLTIGRLSDYFPARNLVIIATIAGCLGTGLLAVPGGAPVAFLAVILIGFTVGGIVGCWYRYVAESFPTRARGTGVLFIGAIFGLGSAVAPAIFGFFLNEQNFVGTALVGALVSLLAGLIILGGKVVAPRKELEEIHI